MKNHVTEVVSWLESLFVGGFVLLPHTSFFYKIAEICNNGNIGITGFNTWK